MNYEQALDKLTKYGQQHLLHFYGELNEAQKKRLLSQIEATDFEVLSSMDAMHKAERGRIAPLENTPVSTLSGGERQDRNFSERKRRMVCFYGEKRYSGSGSQNGH